VIKNCRTWQNWNFKWTLWRDCAMFKLLDY